MRSVLAFVFVVIFSCTKLFGQQMLFFTKDRDQGLPSNEIFDIAAHKSGLMYVAFDKGLFTFNGADFKKIPFKNYKSNSVTSICFDNTQRPWCRNFSNQIFYLENDSMIPLPIDPKVLAGENIIDLKSNQTSILCITESKLLRIDPIHFTISIEKSHTHIYSFGVNKNQVYITSADGSGIISDNRHFAAVQATPKSRIATFNDDFYTASIDNNAVKIQRRYQNKFHDFSKIPCDPNTILLNFQSSQNFLFVATNNGIFIIERDGSYKVLPIKHRVSDATEDREGGIWIATLDNGLIHIPSPEIELKIPNILDQQFNDLTSTPNGFVACTNKGQIIYYDKNFNQIKEINPGQGINLGFLKFEKASNTIYTTNGAINVSGEFSPYYYGKDIALFENNVIFGTHAGLYLKNANPLPPYFKKVDLEHQQSETTEFFSIRKQRVRKIEKINNEELLVAFADGLFHYSSEGVKEILDENQNHIYATSILNIGSITWICTTNNGLIGLNQNKVDFHYTESNGLSSNLTLDAIVNSNGELLIINGNGIDRINPATGYAYSLSDNLGISHLNFYKILKTEDAILAVSNKGIINIPQSIEKKRPLPVIHINGIVNKNRQFFGHNAKLNHDNNNIGITWDLYSFTNGDKINVQARIIPTNEEWIQISSSQSDYIINNLPPGKYTFEIQVPFEKSTLKSINFEILAPWWHLWWVRLIEVLAIIFVLYAILKKAMDYFRKKQEVKEHLIQSQLTALHAQMNPHFLYNVLNSLQGMIYSKRINEAGNFVSFFSEHLRNILKTSDRQEISIKAEIEGLRTYLQLEKFRFEKEFNYEIIKDSQLPDHYTIPSMIIQPFVENAIKHGLLNKQGEKNVSISFSLIKNTIHVSILDNGIGRSASNEINLKRKDKPDSFATHAIYNRIELINKVRTQKVKCDIIDLIDQNNLPVGTKVELTIPVIEP